MVWMGCWVFFCLLYFFIWLLLWCCWLWYFWCYGFGWFVYVLVGWFDVFVYVVNWLCCYLFLLCLSIVGWSLMFCGFGVWFWIVVWLVDFLDLVVIVFCCCYVWLWLVGDLRVMVGNWWLYLVVCWCFCFWMLYWLVLVCWYWLVWFGVGLCVVVYCLFCDFLVRFYWVCYCGWWLFWLGLVGGVVIVWFVWLFR